MTRPTNIERRALATLLDGPKPAYRFVYGSLLRWERAGLIGWSPPEQRRGRGNARPSVILTEAGRVAIKPLDAQGGDT